MEEIRKPQFYSNLALPVSQIFLVILGGSRDEIDDMHMLQKRIQMIEEEDEGEGSEISIPAVTPDVPKRFTVHHNYEYEVPDVKIPESESNDDPFNVQNSGIKHVLVADTDDRKYDRSQNENETPVRLKDIKFDSISQGNILSLCF